MSVNAIRDTNTVFVRELRPLVRDPFAVLFGMIQPLVFLGLYGPLLGGVPGLNGESPWQWFVPGIVVMMTLFGTSTVGARLQGEMLTGAHERLLVTPLSRSALLIGRALKEIVPLLMQAVVIVGVALAFPIGFHFYPLGTSIGLLLLVVFGIGLGSLSYALALACKDREWLFWMVQQTLLFPLLLLSGMLLPLDMGPDWLRAASLANPLTYLVNAERALFGGSLALQSLAPGTLAAFAVAAVRIRRRRRRFVDWHPRNAPRRRLSRAMLCAEMCRSIKTLANFEPPATEDEIHAAAVQFVRKLSGTTRPSAANEAVFDRAVDEVTAAARRLIRDLNSKAPPRDREVEAEKARARARERYARA
jgi:ABC-2 type transport system permease protein